MAQRSTGYILAGNHRYKAAVEAGAKSVPVIWVDVDDETAVRVLLADNRTNDVASYDNAVLAEILTELANGPGLEGTGYDGDDLDQIIGELAGDETKQIVEDEAPEPPADPVTKPGDLWLLGDHRLLCGDSTKPEDVARLMAGERAALLHADPPYGMGKENDGVQNDNLYASKLDAFQLKWWATFRPFLEPNASAYIWGNAPDLWRLWYQAGLGASEKLTMRNEIVWDKANKSGKYDGNGIGNEAARMYALISERCLFFMLGEQGFNNNADNYWAGWEPVRSYLEAQVNTLGWEAGDVKRICGVGMFSHWFTKSQWCFIPENHYAALQQESGGLAFTKPYEALKREYEALKREFYAGRAYFDNTHDMMTDVWKFERVKGGDRHGHATPKPVGMVGRAIASSCPMERVLVEPFLGSGTTLIAAEQLGRKCYGMEISPAYCDVIMQRWENLTGKKAVLADE